MIKNKKLINFVLCDFCCCCFFSFCCYFCFDIETPRWSNLNYVNHCNDQIIIKPISFFWTRNKQWSIMRFNVLCHDVTMIITDPMTNLNWNCSEQDFSEYLEILMNEVNRRKWFETNTHWFQETSRPKHTDLMKISFLF